LLEEENELNEKMIKTENLKRLKKYANESQEGDLRLR
jgi:hypothetical protein